MRLALATLCAACLTVLVGCGAEPAPTQARAAEGRVRWLQSKPASAVGRVRAAVVERPAPDRAWIEAHWEAHADAHVAEANHDCRLRIDLPEGAWLVEGDTEIALDETLPGGSHRWLVSFPLGRPVDAVLRYCACTPQGERAAELAVRLTATDE